MRNKSFQKLEMFEIQQFSLAQAGSRVEWYALQ